MGTSVVESQVKGEIDGDVAQVWKFPTITNEATVLALWLRNQLKEGTTAPRDYALLVRQKPDQFEEHLRPAFEKYGLRLRNESKKLGRSTLQDLMSEQFTCVVLAFFRLALLKRVPNPWSIASEAMERLRAVDPNDSAACHVVAQELADFIRASQAMVRQGLSLKVLQTLFERILTFTDVQAWKRAYPSYSTGAGLEIAIEAFRLHLEAVSDSTLEPGEWVEVFEGNYQVPLMTVHKSKGLEYHTILFVGLDDDAWWILPSRIRLFTRSLAQDFVILVLPAGLEILKDQALAPLDIELTEYRLSEPLRLKCHTAPKASADQRYSMPRRSAVSISPVLGACSSALLCSIAPN